MYDWWWRLSELLFAFMALWCGFVGVYSLYVVILLITRYLCVFWARYKWCLFSEEGYGVSLFNTFFAYFFIFWLFKWNIKGAELSRSAILLGISDTKNPAVDHSRVFEVAVQSLSWSRSRFAAIAHPSSAISCACGGMVNLKIQHDAFTKADKDSR